MDYTKLPRLSRTDAPPGDAAQASDPLAYRSPGTADARERSDDLFGSIVEVWLSVGMGLLFIFLGLDYGKYLFGNTTVYPAVVEPAPEGTGRVWGRGTPKEGQDVLPEELVEPYKTEFQQRQVARKKAYDDALVARSMGILSHSSMFLFGAALIVWGVVAGLTRMSFIPLRLRQGIVGLVLLATLATVVFCGYAVAKMLAANIMPAMTFMCIILGGFVLFIQSIYLRGLMTPAVATAPREMPRSHAPDPDYAPRTPAPSSPAVNMFEAEPASRSLHWRFAHQALRQAALEGPARIVGVLQSPEQSKAFLLRMWDLVRSGGPRSRDPAHDIPDGLESEMSQVGPYSAAIVHMPPARNRGEAQMVALVLRSYTRADGATIERDPLLLYYTLEFTGNSGGDGSPRTVLCEWQGGDHVRFASHPAADSSALREAIWERIEARQKLEDER